MIYSGNLKLKYIILIVIGIKVPEEKRFPDNKITHSHMQIILILNIQIGLLYIILNIKKIMSRTYYIVDWNNIRIHFLDESYDINLIFHDKKLMFTMGLN